jgi:hypothetical protein
MPPGRQRARRTALQVPFSLSAKSGAGFNRPFSVFVNKTATNST